MVLPGTGITACPSLCRRVYLKSYLCPLQQACLRHTASLKMTDKAKNNMWNQLGAISCDLSHQPLYWWQQDFCHRVKEFKRTKIVCSHVCWKPREIPVFPFPCRAISLLAGINVRTLVGSWFKCSCRWNSIKKKKKPVSPFSRGFLILQELMSWPLLDQCYVFLLFHYDGFKKPRLWV